MVRVLAFVFASSLAFAGDPSRVVVLYNANFPDGNGNGVGDSVEVAQHYAARRGVPARNLVACACSVSGTVYSGLAGWTAFWDEIWVPLQAKLSELGEANVDVFLFCYGMPWQLNLPTDVRALDDVLRNPWWMGSRTQPTIGGFGFPNPYFEGSPTRLPDLGRFDHTFQYAARNVWLMARLDGLSADHAKDLVEGALYGERYLSPQPGWYQGFGYIDTRFRAYTDAELAGFPYGYFSYANADKDMAYGKFMIQASGYPLKWENTATDAEIGDPGATFHDGTPAQLAPRALWYGGWYNYAKYNDVWDWLPGSAAVDVDSNSLTNVRTAGYVSFLTQSFARGLTCGTGCIAEPYLNGHPQPQTFLHYLLNGFTFAEAASLSNPYLGWVNLAVGDPLYAPTRAGRVPELDATAPPAPRLRVAGASDTERTITAQFDTLGRAPDLALARVDWGLTPAHGSRVDFGRAHRTRHDVPLTGLAPDALHHFEVTLRDPVGNETRSGDWIFYTKAAAPVLAGVNPPAQTAAPPAPAAIDFTVGHQAGLGSIASVAVLLTATHLGVTDLDVTSLVLALGAGVWAGPGLDLVNLRALLPTALPPGVYSFKLRVRDTGAQEALDTGTVTVP